MESNKSNNKTIKKTWLYLEWLRRSGQTNMYGAVPYLINEFGFDEEEAKKVLIEWMEKYNRNDYLEEIVFDDFD